MQKVKNLLILLICISVSLTAYTVDETAQLFPNDPSNHYQIVIDPKGYLNSENIFDVKQQMTNMSKLDNGNQIRNILVILDNINSDSYRVDIIKFTEQLIFKVFSDFEDRKESLFIVYSINDRIYRIRTGDDVRQILTDKYTVQNATYIKKYLKNSNYEAAFKSLYENLSKCTNGDQKACMIGYVSPWIPIAIIIGFILVMIAFSYYSAYQDNKKKDIQDRLRKRFRTIKEIQEKKIDMQLFLQENCCICMEEFTKKDQIRTETDGQREVVLDCGHNFHQQCINEWSSRNQHCPICRKPLLETTQQRDPQRIPLIVQGIDMNRRLFDIQQELYRDNFTRSQMTDMFERNVWSWANYDSSSYGNSNSRGGGGFSRDTGAGGCSGGW